jgi:hypothetical protein
LLILLFPCLSAILPYFFIPVFQFYKHLPISLSLGPTAIFSSPCFTVFLPSASTAVF